VRSIDLRGNACGPRAAALLTQRLSGGVGGPGCALPSRLRELHLEKQKGGLGARALRLLCAGVGASRALRTLNLAANGLRSAAALHCLCEALGRNRGLTALDLRWNRSTPTAL
jgi:hypothetical protein